MKFGSIVVVFLVAVVGVVVVAVEFSVDVVVVVVAVVCYEARKVIEDSEFFVVVFVGSVVGEVMWVGDCLSAYSMVIEVAVCFSLRYHLSTF